jgi:hypothetical protein
MVEPGVGSLEEFGLRITDYELRITNYGYRSRLPVASGLQVSGWHLLPGAEFPGRWHFHWLPALHIMPGG